MKRLGLGMLLFLLFSIAAAVRGQESGEAIYKTYCAGCHGAELQGNSALPLIKEQWTYGRARSSMVQNVTFGIPGTEMAAFGEVLDEAQVDSVVEYIIAAQETPPSADRALPPQIDTELYTLRIEQVVTEGLETPWGIAFTGPGEAFITERKGSIRIMDDGKLDPQPVRGTPPTAAFRTGGYMDIALDPEYETNGWVYLAYSYSPVDNTDRDAPAMTKVIRGRIEGHRWSGEQTLFEVPDSLLIKGGNRWGSRFLFDDEGYLYFSIGDMAHGPASQDPGQAPGKVYRIRPDGSIPPDNPYAGTPGALGAIFTIGNRNVQGLDRDPATGAIWASEHGPMGGDEINILRKGANYGWPAITYGVDYDGSIVSEQTHRKGMQQPVTYWDPSIAVCPIRFVHSPLFSAWQHNLLVGALKYEELRRLVIDGRNEVSEQEILLKGYGRVRDIEPAPDGSIWVLLNDPDKVLRITPD